MMDSKIEWTHHTFNPVRGCTKISPGCAHCYAESLSKRNPGVLGIWGDNGTRVVASEAAWGEPRKWNRAAKAAGERHRVFCASLSDVFEDRPEWVAPRVRLFHLISETPNLDWLLLTKRPENIRRFCGGQGVPRSWSESMPPNVWLGTSVENQAAADERIPHLLAVPASVHFLSMEPLLGPIDLTAIQTQTRWPGKAEDSKLDALHGFTYSKRERYVLNGIVEEKGITDFVDLNNVAAIDWVIVGGESGHGARGMRSDWARAIRDQCHSAGTAFHFKQWGEWLPDDQKIPHWESEIQGKAIARLDHSGRDLAGMWGLHDESDLIVRRVGKKAAGRLLDGRTWDQLPALVGAAS